MQVTLEVISCAYHWLGLELIKEGAHNITSASEKDDSFLCQDYMQATNQKSRIHATTLAHHQLLQRYIGTNIHKRDSMT